MKCFAWRRATTAAMACAMIGGVMPQMAMAGDSETSQARGSLANAAVVAARIATNQAEAKPARASGSELVFQPQSQWALQLAADDAVMLDAAIELEQPVKVHTPLAQRGSLGLDLLPGEPAQEILELMESTGGSVLDGTLFNSEEHSPEQERQLRRSTIVQTIRQLQEEEIRKAAPIPVPPATETLVNWTTPVSPLSPVMPAPAVPPVSNVSHASAAPSSTASVDELRRVCEQLDQAASNLERQELYQFADQLRETAQQMRLEARRLAAGTRSSDACRATAAATEEASAEVQLQMLRDEVNRLRQQLEARPIASPVSYPRYGLELEPSAAEMRGLYLSPVDK